MIKRTLCFSNPAYLSFRNAQMVIKFPQIENNDTLSETFKKEEERTMPIEDIGVVILDHQQITITHSLLQYLLENNTAVITCNHQHLPTGLMLPLDTNTTQSERYRHQIEASLPLKKQLWQQTIEAKITNQAQVLKRFRNVNVKNILHWATQIKSGDSENMEARAAVFYWANLFPNFIRGRDEAPPNNLLNYGYAILRAIVARALVASGLLPTFGIHHHNKYNAYCLADDIMEPYRPFVDELVIPLFDSGEIELNKNVKTKLLSIPIIEVKINEQRSPLMIAVQQTSSSLYKCFAGENRKIIYPEFNL